MMATSRPIVTLPYGHRPCARCGIIREARPSSLLCKSCVEVLTPAELEAWAA